MTFPGARRTVTLVDATLRDGAQSPLVVFSPEQRLQIAGLLIDAGISDFDAGIPAMGADEGTLLGSLTKQFPESRIIAWCRALPGDLEAAEKAECRAVHIAFPLSEKHLAAVGRNHAWLFASLQGLVEAAKRQFTFVSVGSIDATRAEYTLLARFCKIADGAGADRIRIADTLGILTPNKTNQLFDDLRTVITLDKIEFHAHNDLGMATANAITAIDTGVGSVSVTVNGLGERAGNAALEEVAVALHLAGSTDCQIKLSALQKVCEAVAIASRRPIPASKPISGSAIFLHESGIHWNGLLRDPSTFEPYPPALTGRKPSAPVAGSHSGGATITALLSRCGLEISPAEAHLLAARVRICALELGRPLTIGEVENILAQYREPQSAVKHICPEST